MSAETERSATGSLAGDWPSGIARIHLTEIDSTMAEAARRVAAGSGPAWVSADRQNGGRGRRGRAWTAPPGNFQGTLVMRPGGGPAEAALRSFVASLALREALVALTGLDDSFKLKWPNDLLLNGGKVSGILLETHGAGGRADWLSIGIGVNLLAAPDAAGVEPGAVPPVAVLAGTGIRILPEQLLDHLAPRFAHWEAVLATRGFPPVRDAWLAHAARLGEVIRARTGQAEHFGRFVTVDDSGALVLETAAGRMAVPAAEVYF